MREGNVPNAKKKKKEGGGDLAQAVSVGRRVVAVEMPVASSIPTVTPIASPVFQVFFGKMSYILVILFVWAFFLPDIFVSSR